ncbi:MAG: arginine--tRNA ligase [Candidatus Eisenbacteria bacterium]
MSYQSFEARLAEALVQLAPGELPAEGRPALVLGRPPRKEMGDLAAPAFELAKRVKRNPAELAKEWEARVRAALIDERPDWLEVTVRDVKAFGPYLNLFFDAGSLAALVLGEVVADGANFGQAPPASGQKIMVEYSAPNTNKPLHLGHVRNNLIGMSLSNLLAAAGHDVIRVNLVNDRGVHICKSMLAYQRFGNGETPASTGEKGDHFVGRYYILFDQLVKEEKTAYASAQGVDLELFSKGAKKGLEGDELKAREREEETFDAQFEDASELMGAVREMLRQWEAGDEAVLTLWKQMNEWVLSGFRQTYERMGSKFDHWYFESNTWTLGKDLVEKGLATGVFERHDDGSVWARLESKGLSDKVVLRSDGTSVYITQDLGTAVLKHRDYGMDRSIYVVGSEQQQHFKNLFAMLELLGFPWADGCYHASYGMVTLPHGMGRLKSREGTKVDADDLLDTLHELALAKIEEGGYAESPEAARETAEAIGQGALKMYVLQVSPDKNIQFDPNETISFTGDTGPAVQYSHARIQGIVRKGLDQGKIASEELAGGFLAGALVDASLLVESEEQDVLKKLADFGTMIRTSAENLTVAPVANYLLDLTKLYARMYHEHEVLTAATPELMRARVQLALAVGQVLRNGLAILTVDAPERM